MRKVLTVLAFLMCISAAQADEVNIYSAREENLIKPILDIYARETGTTINLVTGGADELIQRLSLEGANSPADLLLTVDVGRLHRAKDAGVLQAVSSPLLQSEIPAKYRDSEGYWYALSLRSRVIVYDKERVDPSQLSGYADLADPMWRNSVCVRSSSNIYNQSLVASMVSHNGVAQTEEWVRGMVANFARSPQGGDRDQISAIEAGQCKLALVNTYYLGGLLTSTNADERRTGEAVAVLWPDQAGNGAHINISGAAVTKASKNKDAAVALMEYLVSDEAQRWYAETNNEYPVRADVPVSDVLKSWGEFKADDIALDQLGIHNAEAVRLMDRAGWK